jgi:hypothetical protein
MQADNKPSVKITIVLTEVSKAYSVVGVAEALANIIKALPKIPGIDRLVLIDRTYVPSATPPYAKQGIHEAVIKAVTDASQSGVMAVPFSTVNVSALWLANRVVKHLDKLSKPSPTPVVPKMASSSPVWRKSKVLQFLGHKLLGSAALTYNTEDVTGEAPHSSTLGFGALVTKFGWSKHDITTSEYLLQLGPMQLKLEVL